ncbi:UNVERIFIED_CONTAM: hypothetical protein Sangu_3114600 [Sesamum angustifolium]|uniref:Retrotransposon gag domain-containing protein n=1 Tax=Sesamum angustifolium TaxID=2727405 RepID=A0AAW2K701_9LAMI
MGRSEKGTERSVLTLQYFAACKGIYPKIEICRYRERLCKGVQFFDAGRSGYDRGGQTVQFPVGTADLGSDGVETSRCQGSAIAALDRLVDFQVANSCDLEKNKKDYGKEKGKFGKGWKDGKFKKKKHQQVMGSGNKETVQPNVDRTKEGCYLCNGDHRMLDCPKQGKLNALVAEADEDEGGSTRRSAALGSSRTRLKRARSQRSRRQCAGGLRQCTGLADESGYTRTVTLGRLRTVSKGLSGGRQLPACYNLIQSKLKTSAVRLRERADWFGRNQAAQWAEQTELADQTSLRNHVAELASQVQRMMELLGQAPKSPPVALFPLVDTLHSRVEMLQKAVGEWPDMLDKRVTSAIEETSILTDAVDVRVDGVQAEPFGGARSIKELENFLWDMETYFQAARIPEAEKISIASIYLTCDVKLRWSTRLSDDDSAKWDKIETWDVLKKELKHQFLPCNTSSLARESLRKSKHAGTVRDYVKEFSSLMLDVRDMSEEDKLFNFLSGLQTWAQTELRRQGVKDL